MMKKQFTTPHVISTYHFVRRLVIRLRWMISPREGYDVTDWHDFDLGGEGG